MPGARSITRRDEVARLAALVDSAGLNVRRGAPERFSCGCAALDAALPGGGPVRGSLLEWLGVEDGGGATLLAIVAAREAQQGGGAVVVIDRDHGFYPPAAAAWGLDLARTIVVHPASEADERWALDQALRCEHAAAVVAWPRRLDGRTFRRLQLAAEASGAVGLLVRPAAARREPSWAHVRWAVAPQPTQGATDGERWQLAVRLLRMRGGVPLLARQQCDPCTRRPLLDEPAVAHGWVAHPRSAAGRDESGMPSTTSTTPRADLGVPPQVSLLGEPAGTHGERGEILVEIDPVTGAIDEARVGDLAAQLARAARGADPA